MKTLRLPVDHCPWCGYRFDATSGVAHDNTPSPGDFTVCISCASVLQFGVDLKVNPIADSVWTATPEADLLRRARAAVQQMDRRSMV